MIQQLQRLLERRVNQCVNEKEDGCAKIDRKKASLYNRSAEIVKAKADGKVLEKIKNGDHTEVFYLVHFQYLIKQEKRFYIEEEIEKRKATFYKESLMSDDEVIEKINDEIPNLLSDSSEDLVHLLSI